MEKRGKRLIYALIIINLLLTLFPAFVNSASSDSLTTPLTGVSDAINSIPKSTEQIKSDYLRQEWSTLLRKNSFFSQIFSLYDKISPLFDGPVIAPISKILFGMNIELSWLFLLVIVLWLNIRSLVSSFMHFIHPFERIGLISFLVSLAVVIPLGYFKVLVLFSNGFINLVSQADGILVPTILICSFMLLLIILSQFAKGLRKMGETRKPWIAKREAKKAKKEAEEIEEELEERPEE